MLLRWIEQTRKKPKPVRNQYAFVGALLATGFIVGFWALSVPAHLASINEKYDDEEQISRGLFSGFVDDVKNQFAAAFGARQQEEQLNSDTDSNSAIARPSIQLDVETVQELHDQYKITQQPPPKTVLIGTTSKDHIKIDSEGL